ncbi:acetate/propionate family kinase [Terriglobus roseus]|uniref:Acetate kinase n=1 Tax=Terriglobus roseus TaxID=392734 RepID=A0A1H4L0M5_9BACT|nr:acetate/propionate family kinase [Terriglobus roseus]SEB64320.1 acetate kinase [Terriglobus roseus]
MMTEHSELILTINHGSSSLKIAFFEVHGHTVHCVLRGAAEALGNPPSRAFLCDSIRCVLFNTEKTFASPEKALEVLYAAAIRILRRRPTCVGYRVVHGGPHLLKHCRIDDEVLMTLKESIHFAPLHIPQALTIMQHMRTVLPYAVHCACFDTTFHRTMQEVATRLPLPQRYFDAGIRRYGFHGLSYASIVERLGSDVPERMIIAHLGNGSSLCALRHGNSIDTTMCFTPTGGIPMATRSGDLDPGVLLFLMRTYGLGADELEAIVNRQSGLAALTGGGGDMRAILKGRNDGNACAELAIQTYTRSVRKAIGAYAALLGGVDRLIFTGGIGEHSNEIRDMVCGGLESLGIRQGDRGKGNVMVMAAGEEQEIAHICRTIG